MTEFTLRLANRPGQFARLAKLLDDAGIEIEAFAAVGNDGRSQLRFIVESPHATRRVLTEASLEYDEQPVLDTFLPRGSGALAHMAGELGRAGVNIDSMYLLHSNAEGFHLAVTVDDADLAHRTLNG